MSACPPPESLVGLIGENNSLVETRALSAHVKECAACAGELAALRDSFAALQGPRAEGTGLGAVPSAPMALRRIQVGVQREISEERRIADSLLVRGGLAGLAAAAALAVWRLAAAHPLTAPAGLMLLILPLAAALALRSTLRLQQLICLFGVVLGLGLAVRSLGGRVVPLSLGLGCFALFASGAVGPALLLAPAARRLGFGGLRAALLGLAICAGGTALQASLCPLGGAAHVTVMHLLPFAAGTLLAAWLGARRIIQPKKSYRPA